jgi:hypothetical protein
MAKKVNKNFGNPKPGEAAQNFDHVFTPEVLGREQGVQLAGEPERTEVPAAVAEERRPQAAAALRRAGTHEDHADRMAGRRCEAVELGDRRKGTPPLMTDPVYFCTWCDQSFKSNAGLDGHVRLSKAHAKRVASLGQMPPEEPPVPEVQPEEDVQPATVNAGIPQPTFEVTGPIRETEDGMAYVAPESSESIADALAGLEMTFIEDEELHVPVEDIDLSDQEVLKVGARPNRKLNVSLRTIKMLAPVCREHNDGSPGWWYTCLEVGHDPYRSIVEKIDQERKLSPPDERGRRRVLGTEEVSYFVVSHNTRQLAYTGKHNGGIELSQASGKGWVLPETRGVAPFCQFMECWVQNPQVSTPYGDYCIREQAQLVAAEATGTFLVVNDSQIRARQIAALGV